jgi:hypothetical protein
MVPAVEGDRLCQEGLMKAEDSACAVVTVMFEVMLSLW